ESRPTPATAEQAQSADARPAPRPGRRSWRARLMRDGRHWGVMSKYWLVGASWGGTDHQDEKWVEQGIWMLGWKKGHQPEKAAAMQQCDRIAIKGMKGNGQTGIRIVHLGVIKGVILETDRVICTVNWV